MAKPKKPNPIPDPEPTYHYPTPDEEGIRKTKELYLSRKGIELTDEQAYHVLSRVMLWLFHLNTLPPQESANGQKVPAEE